MQHGTLEARSAIVLFTDADLAAPIEDIEKLLRALETADVVVGSRAVDRFLIEFHQPRARELAEIILNRFV